MTATTDQWQALMDSAYDKWQGESWNYRRFLSNLDAVERKAVLLGNFHYQTTNGGLQQWVENGYASGSGTDLLDVLEEIDTENSRRVLGIIRSVLELVDLGQENLGCCGNYWLDPWVDDEPPAWMDEIEALTDKYYSMYDDFVVDAEGFLTELTK